MSKKGNLLLSLILAVSMILTACGSNNGGGNTPSTPTETSNSNTEGEGKTEAEQTNLTLWTFVQQHADFYLYMADEWNQANPDKPIKLVTENIPYDEMHTRLLIALQTKEGAPDLVDIEQSKFPNFMKGEVQLVELNDVVEPELSNIVKSRVDIYSQDGKYYGVDLHVGATVMFYNKEIMDQAGVNPDDIKLWSDVEKYGKIVVEKTGKPFITFEGAGNWSWWPAINQLESDQVSVDGKVMLDDERNIRAMTFFKKLVDEGIAAIAPGAGHDTPEYKAYMNAEGAASVFMPFWFMNRFTDEMPDLKGKIIIKPMPAWDEGGNRSAGMGGTGLSITNQTKHLELAKEFLAYSKLSKEGNIQVWKQLGMDPIRTEVWTDPAMSEPNKFTEYFGNDIFDTLLEVKDEIYPVNIREISPQVFDSVRNEIIPRIFQFGEDPETVIKEEADKLRKSLP
ncbi:MAG: extracellular solute-binding protein [Candidatus Pristimantibacillus lignocellulolyticus]|uniref:Extracellular solute-binding protein n=1 Tax=Candidatus Pristimantibacillus lignocellulolyticus TaxID=2994561 RepID=A0A9J6Z9X2_9BACL|nr:MAG: extracellular solute-binding protein [Candidatus Pristimantibacillus lignocellulolyticus]